MDDRRNQGGGRFVILRHEMPQAAERGSHWDLMLENRGFLLTWEFPKLPPGPLPASFEQLGIRPLANHRIDYLEYQGPVSNDRGTVQRVDFGDYQLKVALQDDSFQVTAIGRRFHIELLVPKAIFEHDEGSLQDGQVLEFGILSP